MNKDWQYNKLSVSYSRVHFLFLTGSGGSRAARMASSKTFLRPFCVKAEHSTYFTARSSLASLSDESTVIGRCFCLASFSMLPASSLKSICVPTSKNGVLGQWWVISGTHYKKSKINKSTYSLSINETARLHRHTLPTLSWWLSDCLW